MKGKTAKILLVLVLALALSVSAVGLGHCKDKKDKVYNWRMTNLMPKGVIGWDMYQQFADHVERASNGRMKITLYGVGELMSALETWDAVANGVVQMDWSTGLYWQGKTSLASFVVGLPYTTRNWSEMCSLLWDAGIEELVRKDYAKQNIHLLSIFPVQSTTLTSKFPVNEVADLKGKKIRAGGIQAEVFQAAGAAPVLIPVPEVYQALDTGVVDGAVMGGLVAAGVFSLYEKAPYGMLPPMVAGSTEEIRVNLDAWNELPDDLKAILEMAAREHFTNWMAWQRKLRAQMLKKMSESGFELVVMPDEEYRKMQKIAMGVYEKHAEKDEKFKEGLAIVKDFMASIGQWKVLD